MPQFGSLKKWNHTMVVQTYGNDISIYGGRARPRGPGGSMKYQFVYLNVVTACLNELDSVCWNGRGQGNLPGGSLRYQFVYLKVRIFKCSYRMLHIAQRKRNQSTINGAQHSQPHILFDVAETATPVRGVIRTRTVCVAGVAGEFSA